MLFRLRKYLLLLHRFSWTHPKTVLGVTSLAFLVSIAGVTKLQFLLSIDDLVDPDFQTYRSLKKMNSEFKDKNTVLLSIESEAVFTKTFLCDLQSWILSTAETRSDLAQIQSTFGIRQATLTENRLKIESFLDLECTQNYPEKEKIEQAFKRIQRSPWSGLLSSKSGYTISVNFIVLDPKDKSYGSVDVNVVPALQASFENQFLTSHNPQNKITVFWGGITTYESYLKKAFDQTQILNALMYLIALFIFRFFLGSWKAGFVFNFTILISMTITYGLMGFLHVPVDVLTNTVGLMMIVACLEDFVFVVFGMARLHWSFRKSLRRFFWPSFFTSLTTAIGFASLGTSDLSVIRRFGFISAFAAMLEWAMVFLFLASLLKYFRYFNFTRTNYPLINIKFGFSKTLPRWLALALCIPIVVPFVWGDHLTIRDSPESFFFKSHIVLQSTEHFKKTRGWLTEVSIVFNDANTIEQNKDVLNQFRKIKLVERIEDSYTNNGFLAENLNAKDKKMIEPLLDQTLAAQRLISKEGTQRAQLFLNSMEMEEVKNLIEAANSICTMKKCQLVGGLISYNEFSVKILNTLFSSLGLSILLVALLIVFIKRSLRWTDTAYLVVSAIWGPLVLLTLFIIFKIPLSFVSCICASLLVGLAGDNAIQFIFRSYRSNLGQSINELAEASLIVTIGMMLLISVFMFSIIASIAMLGVSILAGLALAFFGDVWILRGLLNRKN